MKMLIRNVHQIKTSTNVLMQEELNGARRRCWTLDRKAFINCRFKRSVFGTLRETPLLQKKGALSNLLFQHLLFACNLAMIYCLLFRLRHFKQFKSLIETLI